jgi:hypothetical protein
MATAAIHRALTKARGAPLAAQPRSRGAEPAMSKPRRIPRRGHAGDEDGRENWDYGGEPTGFARE